MPISAVTTALNRFGLGARFDLGEAQRKAIAADPRGWLAAELVPERALLNSPNLKDTHGNLLLDFAQQDQKRMEREQNKKLENATNHLMARPQPKPIDFANLTQNMQGGNMQAATMQGPIFPIKDRPVQREIYVNEAQARWQKSFDDPSGFIERLVWFWSNHFAVSIAKGQQVTCTAGSFEREAIRPYVLGKFGDMLMAVEQHPTMLFFLDNRNSIGPNSKNGQKQKKGLNENLAREILELHTLGVDGGYTQADVTNLARIITGWAWYPNNPNFEPAKFIFNPNTHEPGQQTVLKQTFAQEGVTQGEAVLKILAHHPATAKHLATKFVRHFVGDDPQPALVGKLTRVFLDTQGDLMAFTKALLGDDAAWNLPANKIRLPQEFLVAASRGLNLPPNRPERLLNALTDLGQPLWKPSGPNGFGDRAQDWASAEGMKMRFAYAVSMSQGAAVSGNPTDIANIILADAISPDTSQAIARAESKAQGLALLLMSPEFQRR